jgi:hypothetical protein
VGFPVFWWNTAEQLLAPGAQLAEMLMALTLHPARLAVSAAAAMAGMMRFLYFIPSLPSKKHRSL